MQATRFTQFVIKVSKHCNLRCRYCYELESLDDTRKMSRHSLLKLYENIASYYIARDLKDDVRTEIRFIWHGGEPLLIDPQFYWQTFTDQKERLGDSLRVVNSVQTNLTKLDDARIELLCKGFDHVGVSLDVFGGLRLRMGGQDSQPRVLANLDRLRAAGARVGCISVLTKRNILSLEKIHTFFSRAALDYSVLPLFEGAHTDQHATYDLTTERMAAACMDLIDLWLSGDASIQVTPINDYINIAVRHLTGTRHQIFDKRNWNTIMLVNTNGDCYSYGDPYGNPDWCLGNLFTQTLTDILTGEPFFRSVASAERRMAFSCTRCEYFGACDGYSIAEYQTNCRETEPSPDGDLRRCVFERRVIAHTVARLRALGVGTPSARDRHPPATPPG